MTAASTATTAEADPRQPRPHAFAIAAVVVAVFSLPILLANVWVATGAWSQLRAARFAAVPGTIVASRVVDRGGHPRFEAEYEYAFAGRVHRGGAWRFSPLPPLGEGLRAALPRRFPAGAGATVYVDPAQPDRAILAPGLHGWDVLLLLFIFALDLIPLSALVVLRQMFGPAPWGISVVRRGGQIAIHAGLLPRHQTLVLSMGLFLGGACALTAALGTAASTGAVALGWAALLATVPLIYRRETRKRASGRRAVIVDAAARTVTLPARPFRHAPQVVALADIEEIVVTRKVYVSYDGGGHEAYDRVRLRVRGLPEPVDMGSTPWSEGVAVALAGVLRELRPGDPPALTRAGHWKTGETALST